MPALQNARHELFAQELAKGQNQTEAYERAGYKRDETAASRLSRNVKVAGRLAELQERAARKVVFTIEDAFQDLESDRQLAHRQGQAGAAVAATVAKSKLFGLITDKAKLEHAGPDGGPIDNRITVEFVKAKP